MNEPYKVFKFTRDFYYLKNSFDQWAEKETKLSVYDKAINIEAGDQVQVTWLDGSVTTETLSILESEDQHEHDNGYGRQHWIKIPVRKAYFTYEYRGIVHKVFLRFFPEGMKFEKVTTNSTYHEEKDC